MTDAKDIMPGWQPAFSDYLYTSSTNATAFSPTDTMPITGWAKLLMSAQSLSSFVLVVLVTARAVNILEVSHAVARVELLRQPRVGPRAGQKDQAQREEDARPVGRVEARGVDDQHLRRRDARERDAAAAEDDAERRACGRRRRRAARRPRSSRRPRARAARPASRGRRWA